MTLKSVPDPVGAAVAAVEEREQAPAPIEMVQRQVTISSSGRPAILVYPQDMSETELAELTGWMLTQLRSELLAARAASSRIIVPRH